jgi:large subunit ribosomal protein L24
MLGAALSDRLREKHGVKTIPVRQGDSVRISKGDFSGIDGKVIKADAEKNSLLIEGVTRENVSGTAIRVPIHSSNVVITTLNLDDKWRKRKLERKKSESAEKEVRK